MEEEERRNERRWRGCEDQLGPSSLTPVFTRCTSLTVTEVSSSLSPPPHPPLLPAGQSLTSLEKGRRLYLSNSTWLSSSFSQWPSFYIAVAAVACVFIAPIASAAECPSFSDIDHGSITYIEAEFTLGARFTCDQGYDIVGNDFIQCSINGTWNGTAPECQPIVCESLPTIPNGQVHETGTAVGSKATYVCIKGFSLEGDEQRECLTNSTWTGTQPECKRIVCTHPGTPSHATASPADMTDYPTGTIITYRCVEGYNIEGSARTVCSEEGSWTTPIPTCKVTDCGPPPNISHATPRYTSTVLNQPVTYQCDPGYTSHSETLLICIKTGQWSGSRHPCTEITTPTSKTASVVTFTVTQNMSLPSRPSPSSPPTTLPSSSSPSSPSVPSPSHPTITVPPSPTTQSTLPTTVSTHPSTISTTTTSYPISTTTPTSYTESSTQDMNQITKVSDDASTTMITTPDPSQTSAHTVLATSTTTLSQSAEMTASSPEMTASSAEMTASSAEMTASSTDYVKDTETSSDISQSSHQGSTSTAEPTQQGEVDSSIPDVQTTESQSVITSTILMKEPGKTTIDTTTLKSTDTSSPHIKTKKADTTTLIPMQSTSYMKGVRIGIIVGIVLGAILTVVFIVICSVILCKRKRIRGAYEVRYSKSTKDETSIIIEPAKPAPHSNGHVVSNGHDNHVTVWRDDGYMSHIPGNNTRRKQSKTDNNHHKDYTKDPNWNDDTLIHIPKVHGRPHGRTQASNGSDGRLGGERRGSEQNCSQSEQNCSQSEQNSSQTIPLSHFTPL